MTLCELKYRYVPLTGVVCPAGCGGFTDGAGKCDRCHRTFELEQTLRVYAPEEGKLTNL